MIKLVLAAVALLQTAVVDVPQGNEGPIINPTIDLSAIRQIVCYETDSHGQLWRITGTGELVGDNVLSTAFHVAKHSKIGQCVDGLTEAKLTIYEEDPVHDSALMTGDLPKDIPYIKYRCGPIVPGQRYMSYGISNYNLNDTILRMNILTATKDLVTDDNSVEGFPHSLGMRVFDGAIVPGTSGGPVMDSNGYMVAVNNAGSEVRTLLFPLADTILCKGAG